MIYKGVSAIDYLSTQIQDMDPCESSHWRKFNSSFRYSSKGFSGLQGFGGNSPGWRTPLHRVFQRPFRMMGKQFPEFEYIDETATTVTSSQKRAYDLDVLRQTLTIAFLREKIPDVLSLSSMGCVIGDGFGSATSLLVGTWSASCVVLVNLTKTLMVDLWYLKQWMGEANFDAQVRLVTDVASLDKVLADYSSRTKGVKVIAIQAKDHHLIRQCPIDFAINIASMGEMNPEIIGEYFSDLRALADSRRVFFYCANRLEKELPDGTVTRFENYPWSLNDEIKVDELCPWTQYYYAFMPPFYRPYDGPFQHRLVKLY